MIWAIFKQN